MKWERSWIFLSICVGYSACAVVEYIITGNNVASKWFDACYFSAFPLALHWINQKFR